MTWAFIVLLLAGVLTACGGNGGASQDSEPAEGSAAKAPSATGNARGETGDGAGDQGAGSGEGSRAQGREGAAKKPQAPLAAARKVIHSAELRVRADDVDASAAKAKQMVTAAGGYVERESSQTEPPRSEITLKIPTDRYTDLLNRLGADLGTKLELSQDAEDVTGEVADVAARVRSAEAALTSFRKLYERADSIDEIIRLEDEIAEREADLEALQARQKSLEDSTSFATVTVTLVGKSAPAEEPDDGGFMSGLRSGWSAFTTFVGVIATVFGWLLPFLITAAVLGLPVLAFRHRLRDRFWTPAAPAAPAPPAGGDAPGPRPGPENAAVGSAESPAQGQQGPPAPQ